MVKYFLLLILISAGMVVYAQDTLPAPVPDTGRRVVRQQRQMISKPVPAPVTRYLPHFRLPDSSFLGSPINPDSAVMAGHPIFRFTNPVRYSITIRKWEGKETIFYAIIALLLFFALIRNGFTRYISDLFKIFFRTTVKQRQIKEQLVQSPLPSLLLNIFFLLSGGMFLALLLHYYGMGLNYDFWELFFYCMTGLLAVYGVKFISLKLLGWVFQVSDSIDAYIFVVFTTNKVIGMALVPFLVILGFTQGLVNQSAMTLSIIVVLGLFAYRFFLSYSTLHRQIRISFFHFFLYLCAFEIAPLLLINKLLFRFLGETY
ncbi:MAG: DUF4271 domain-containing protein [Flavisolibacter sp.]